MPPTTVNDRGSKSPVGHTINAILGLKEQYSSESDSSGSSTDNSGSDREGTPSPVAEPSSELEQQQVAGGPRRQGTKGHSEYIKFNGLEACVALSFRFQ